MCFALKALFRNLLAKNSLQWMLLKNHGSLNQNEVNIYLKRYYYIAAVSGRLPNVQVLMSTVNSIN